MIISKTRPATVVTAALVVLSGSIDASATPAHALPPLNPTTLRASIAGLPDAHVTSAQVGVDGPAGRWFGRSGVADVRTDRVVPDDGRFRIGSVTKMFTATIALQLAGEDRLDLAATVQSYLPGLLPARYPAITIGQLLEHTSGLPMSQEDAGNADPAWVVQHRFDTFTPRQIVRTAIDRPMAFPPGTHQQYNGLNYILAGLVIEKVTGRSFAHELTARILHPLRLHDTSLPRPDDVGIHGRHAHGYVTVNGELVDVTAQSPSGWAESGMVSTTTDLARFLSALLRGRLLPAAELRHMFTVPDVPYYGDNSGCAQGPQAGQACFSMGLQRTEFPGGLTVWGKSGGTPGYSTLVVATRDARRVLSVSLTPTGNRDGAENDYLLRIAAAAFGIDVG